MGVQVASTTALSVGANTKSADIVNGTYQFVPFPGEMVVYSRCSATGLFVTVVVNGTNVINDQAITFTGTAGALSKADHEVASLVVDQGSRIEVFFRNTTAGALTADCVVELNPMDLG